MPVGHLKFLLDVRILHRLVFSALHDNGFTANASRHLVSGLCLEVLLAWIPTYPYVARVVNAVKVLIGTDLVSITLDLMRFLRAPPTFSVGDVYVRTCSFCFFALLIANALRLPYIPPFATSHLGEPCCILSCRLSNRFFSPGAC